MLPHFNDSFKNLEPTKDACGAPLNKLFAESLYFENRVKEPTFLNWMQRNIDSGTRERLNLTFPMRFIPSRNILFFREFFLGQIRW